MIVYVLNVELWRKAYNMLTPDEIHKRHSYQRPTEAAAQMHEWVNGLTEMLARNFEDRLPEGREKALVHTHLEEVRFWANAAIARNHEKL